MHKQLKHSPSAHDMHDDITFDADHPLMRSHLIQGQRVLPGMAYIDLLFQLLRRHGHDPMCGELRDLTIYRPLALMAGQKAALHLRWEAIGAGEAAPEGGAGWQVTIEARVLPATAGQHAADCLVKATILVHPKPHRWSASANALPDIDVQSVLAQAPVQVPLEDIYAAFRGQGLLHEPFMRVQGALHDGQHEAYAICTLDGSALASSSGVLFHPALIDGSGIAMSGIALQDLNGGHAPALYLPVHIGGFRATEPMTKACLARMRKLHAGESGELRTTTIDFFDMQGRMIAQLKDVKAKRVRDPSGDDSPPLARSTPLPGTGGVHPAAARRMEALVQGVLAGRLGRAAHEIDVHAAYHEIGLSSVVLMEVVQSLGERLGRSLPPTLLFEHTSVAALAGHLALLEAGVDQGLHQGLDQGTDEAAGVSSPQVSPVSGTPASPLEPHDVAIIGITGRYPGAPDLQALWQRLQQGDDLVREVPGDRWEHREWYDPEKGRPGKTHGKWGGFIDGVAQFDALHFQISPAQAALMDPQERLFLQATWHLLESAGYTRDSLHRDTEGQVGLYVGAMYQHYRMPDTDAVLPGLNLSSYSAIANRTSGFFGFEGPSIAVDTMCSSAALAIHLACKDLLAGECRVAIAGGVNLHIDAQKYLLLGQTSLLASDPAMRSFSEGDGYLPAEGVGAVLLKPLAQALADGDDVLAVIKGSATLHVGRAAAHLAPSLQTQVRVMRRCLERAGVLPSEVSYVEAAANGSSMGDAIEVAALCKVFGEGRGQAHARGAPCTLGSVKSNMGHPEAASAMAQLSKVVLQMRHGELVPTRLPQGIDPGLSMGLDPALFTLAQDHAPWQPCDASGAPQRRRALINAFAAGGTYVSLLIEEAPMRPPASARTDGTPHIVVLSARTPARLRAHAAQLLAHIEQEAQTDLHALARTLQSRREAMACRLATVVGDRDALIERLRDWLAGSQRSQPVLHEGNATESGPALQRLMTPHLHDTIASALAAERDLERLALFWTQGGVFDWAQVHGGAPLPPKVDLPLYPFEPLRCWLDKARADGPPVATPAIGDTLIDQVLADIVHFLSGTLGVQQETLGADNLLADYGVSSLVGLKLVRRLGAKFSVHLTGREFITHPTAAMLARLIVDKVSDAHAAFVKPIALPMSVPLLAPSSLPSTMRVPDPERHGGAARAYYAAAGPLSEVPLKHRKGLPDDVPGLAKVVQGLLMHEHQLGLYGLLPDDAKRDEVHLRSVGEMLAHLVQREGSAITVARPPSQRLVCLCRHFALMMAALLRTKGIPARARCGFAAFFSKEHMEDHWMTEYWSPEQGRWIMVDAQLDVVQHQGLGIDFDSLDVPQNRFITAARAWTACRQGLARSDAFGLFDYRGWFYLAGSVIRDVVALNQAEMLSQDGWGGMPGPDEPVSDELASFLDRVAWLALDPDTHFDALRQIYESDARIHVPGQVFNIMRQRMETVPWATAASPPAAKPVTVSVPVAAPSSVQPDFNQATP